jgi:hypothetical protein
MMGGHEMIKLFGHHPSVKELEQIALEAVRRQLGVEIEPEFVSTQVRAEQGQCMHSLFTARLECRCTRTASLNPHPAIHLEWSASESCCSAISWVASMWQALRSTGSASTTASAVVGTLQRDF